MKQITEDYVSFETAKLLKENGFDEPCIGFYNPTDGCFFEASIRKSWDYDRYGSISAPTHQMAMKWLREVHGLNIQPYIVRTIELKRAYNVTIYDNNCEQIKSHFGSNIFDGFISYEDAVEASILYVLKNLI